MLLIQLLFILRALFQVTDMKRRFYLVGVIIILIIHFGFHHQVCERAAISGQKSDMDHPNTRKARRLRYHGDLAASAVFRDCKFIKNVTFDAWVCTE